MLFVLITKNRRIIPANNAFKTAKIPMYKWPKAKSNSADSSATKKSDFLFIGDFTIFSKTLDIKPCK